MSLAYLEQSVEGLHTRGATMRLALCTAVAFVLFAAQCSAQMGEFRDMMSNCRFEGGYCIDPNRPQASADPGEAAENGGAAGGRQQGPNPLGRRHQPRQMGMWDTMSVLNRMCANVEIDMGCWRTGGYCCTPYP